MRYAAFILVALALLLSLSVAPVSAQQSDSTKASSDSREASLRDWFNGLGKARQEELKKRFRAFKHLPKERQQQIFKAVKEGKPILTEQQRENLKKLKKLDYLERVRLYTVAAELQALRRGRPAEFKAAMESERPAAELHKLMLEQRVQMHLRSLTPAERAEFARLTPEQRRERMQSEHKQRLEELQGFYPRFAELREAAAKGDKEARKELRQAVADLRTLDQLLQRLEPEKRKEMLAELRDLTIDEAAGKVRRALQDQWQKERKQPSRERKDQPRMAPERNGKRGEDRRTREQ
jgi:hypothetical protein